MFSNFIGSTVVCCTELQTARVRCKAIDGREKRQERLAFEKENFEKELEAKMALEQAKVEKQGLPGASSHSVSDATKNIRLVPKFEEREVDKYFLHFEKIAESSKWPKES